MTLATSTPMDFLTQLPVRVLKNSQIQGKISLFPETLQTFIIDVRKPVLNASMIRRNKNIEFVISVNPLRPRAFHLSNSLEGNVKLFTTRQCLVNITSIGEYKDVVFQSLTLSHAESPPTGQDVNVLRYLLDLNIERLILDYSNVKVDSQRLESHTNIL